MSFEKKRGFFSFSSEHWRQSAVNMKTFLKQFDGGMLRLDKQGDFTGHKTHKFGAHQIGLFITLFFSKKNSIFGVAVAFLPGLAALCA